MKKISMGLLLFITTFFAHSQHTIPDSISQKPDTLKRQDSEYVRLKTYDSLDRVSMNHNLDELVKTQRDREKKDLERMYIRIAIGVVMLVVLIVRLRRKRKPRE